MLGRSPLPSNPARRKLRRGFTLVEILIVVVILGILAAMVLPQFADASNNARRTNMTGQLQTLRSTIELYRLQHRDQPPKLLSGGGWTLFTSKTLVDGTLDDTGPCGPYLTRIPVNPLTQSSAIADLGDAPASTPPLPGWFYDEENGRIYGANSEGQQTDTGT